MYTVLTPGATYYSEGTNDDDTGYRLRPPCGRTCLRALLDGIDGDVDDYIGGMLHALTGTDPIEAFSALMWMAAAMTQRVAEVTGFDSRQVVDSWLQARYKD